MEYFNVSKSTPIKITDFYKNSHTRMEKKKHKIKLTEENQAFSVPKLKRIKGPNEHIQP